MARVRGSFRALYIDFACMKFTRESAREEWRIVKKLFADRIRDGLGYPVADIYANLYICETNIFFLADIARCENRSIFGICDSISASASLSLICIEKAHKNLSKFTTVDATLCNIYMALCSRCLLTR